MVFYFVFFFLVAFYFAFAFFYRGVWCVSFVCVFVPTLCVLSGVYFCCSCMHGWIGGYMGMSGYSLSGCMAGCWLWYVRITPSPSYLVTGEVQGGISYVRAKQNNPEVPLRQ